MNRSTSALRPSGMFIVALVILPAISNARGAHAPEVPPGMARCTAPLPATALPARPVGETVRYHVDVGGVSVGHVDFKVERQGRLEGAETVEYRSAFAMDTLVDSLVGVSGQAASMVPLGAAVPRAAMNRYELKGIAFREDLTYREGGFGVVSERTKNGEVKRDARTFPIPAHEFISAFYMMRGLSPTASGCIVVYGNQRAYTVWIAGEGEQSVQTPLGEQPADRYAITYGSDRGKDVLAARIWLGKGPDRLPYRVEIDTERPMVARVHLFNRGAR